MESSSSMVPIRWLYAHWIWKNFNAVMGAFKSLLQTLSFHCHSLPGHLHTQVQSCSSLTGANESDTTGSLLGP